VFPAVGVSREGRKGFPSNFPRSERCRGLSAARVFNLNELVAKGLGFPLQIGQHPATVLLFIGLLARIHIGRAIAPHALDEPCQLMRRRGHRLGGAQPRSHPTVIGSQGAVTLDEALGGEP
jgi:hypothetical protein